jgi:hypothetical protein
MPVVPSAATGRQPPAPLLDAWFDRVVALSDAANAASYANVGGRLYDYSFFRPAQEALSMANIHLIGGEKGGVGKSVVARVLAQYMIDKNIPFVGFDTDRSHGSLIRFYSDFASPMLIDSYESLDTMVELAAENPDERILVDLAAQTHERLVKWMDESGVLEALKDHGLSLTYWHVMDSGKDSLSLLKSLFDRFGSRLNYVLVQNQLRGDNFDLFENSAEKAHADGLHAKIIQVKRLNQEVIAKIDAENSSFWAAQQKNPTTGKRLGILQRQRVKVWLQHAYEQVDRVGL